MANLAVFFLLSFAAPAAAVNLGAGRGLLSLHMDLSQEAGATPVAKIVALLKDMQKQLEKEGEEDEETYETLVCWCTTNDKEKTKSIGEAEAKIDELTKSIGEAKAKID